MNLRWRLKEYCQKNKQQRWDICEEFSVWHFVTNSTGLKSVEPRMSSHFPESRDPSYINSPMYPECRRKEWQTKSFGLQSTPRESGPKFAQGLVGVITSPTFLGPVLVWSQQNYLRLLLIVSYFLLGLLPPRPSPKEKRTWKWVYQWICRPASKLSIYEIVFSLFAKNECRIQRIKHIWTETCVFVKMI